MRRYKCLSVAATMLFTVVVSCKQELSQEFLQSLKHDNELLEEKVKATKTVMLEQIFAMRKLNRELQGSILKQKKTAFEKEMKSNEALIRLKKRSEKAIKSYEENCQKLSHSILANHTFIESLPRTEHDEDAIYAYWNKHLLKLNKIISDNSDLQVEMADILREYKELINDLKFKFGKKQVSSIRTINKNKE